MDKTTTIEQPMDSSTEAAAGLPTEQSGEQEPLPPPLRADSSLRIGVERFEEYMVRKGFSINTIKAFRNDLKILIGFMDGDTKLHLITTKHLNDFLEWLLHDRGKPCSAKTLSRRITTIKVFFSWLHSIGILGTDPAEPIVQQPARPPLPIILTDDEISQLVEAAESYLQDEKKPDARPPLLFHLLLQTGIKKAECARIHCKEDVEFAEPDPPALHIRYADERHAHKNRQLTLDAAIGSILTSYEAQYKPENLLFDCTPRNLEYILDDVGQRAGITRIKVGFEAMRWTSAVRDYRSGMSQDMLRQKMGLSPISWRETREKLAQLAG